MNNTSFLDAAKAQSEAAEVPADAPFETQHENPSGSDRPTLTTGDDGFQWPDLPNKRKLDPLPEVPVEAMPTILRKMCVEISETYKIPIEVPMLNALCFAGFAAGKYHRAKIGPVKVRPNLYAGTFQSPVERKSSGFSPLLVPVNEWIKDQIPEWKKASSENEIVRGKIERLKKEIISGRSDNEYTARAEMEKLESQPLNLSPCYVMGDASEGAMADRMTATGGDVLVASSDAKSILAIIMGKFTNGDTEDGLLLQAYDGTEPFMSSRRTSGDVVIDEPMAGIAIMTQINQLKKLSEKGDLFTSGLISRFMFCFPDAMAGKRGKDGDLIRKFSKREVSDEAKSNYNNLIHELLDYSRKMQSPITLPIDSDAEERWIEFSNKVEAELGSHGDYADCGDVAGRLPIHALRFSLILAICHNPAHPSISRQDVVNGIKLVSYYWKHMERALSIMSKRDMPGIPRRIVQSLQKNGKRILNARAMQQSLSNVNAAQMQEAINWLLDHHYCREIEIVEEGSNRTGKPRNPEYEINPDVFEG